MNDLFDVCAGLQVTLVFELPHGAILDREAMSAQVREGIEPLVRQNVLSGSACLKGIRFVKNNSFGQVLGSGSVDLPVTWKAHKPWWADDNQEWDKVPFAAGYEPPSMPHAT